MIETQGLSPFLPPLNTPIFPPKPRRLIQIYREFGTMIETQGLSPYSLLGIWDNDCATRINETPTPLKALKINHCPIVQNTHHPQALENQSLSHCPRLLYREEEKKIFFIRLAKKKKIIVGLGFSLVCPLVFLLCKSPFLSLISQLPLCLLSPCAPCVLSECPPAAAARLLPRS